MFPGLESTDQVSNAPSHKGAIGHARSGSAADSLCKKGFGTDVFQMKEVILSGW